MSNRNADLRFVKGLAKYLGMCFPERIGRIFVVNNGMVVKNLWRVVKPFLDPVTAKQIVFCGTKAEVLLEQLEANHPFLQYILLKQQTKGKGTDNIALPKSSPYSPTWERAIMEDERDLNSKTEVAPASEGITECDSDAQKEEKWDSTGSEHIAK